MPWRVLGPAHALRPDRAIGPDHDFLDRPENPGPDQLDALAEAVLGRALVAHLGAELLLGGEGAHQPRFLDRPGQRLLAEAVLAHPHGHHARRGVGVVGRADGHGVDLVAQLLEHLAVVEVLLRFGVLLPHLVEDVAVDVAEGDDLAVRAGVVGVAVALAADADAREADLLVRRRRSERAEAEAPPRSNEPVPARADLLEKLTTVHGGDSEGEEGGFAAPGRGGSGDDLGADASAESRSIRGQARQSFSMPCRGRVRNLLPRFDGPESGRLGDRDAA